MYYSTGRRALRLALLMVFAVLLASACGGGGDGGEAKKQEEAKVRPVPQGEGVALRPGPYTSKKFEPPLSFSVLDGGWQVEIPEAPDVLDISRGEEEFGFFNVRNVYDPNEFAAQQPAPEDMVAWLQEHPNLEAEKPSQVSVGGVRGQQLDVVATDVPNKSIEFCGVPCVLLYPTSEGFNFVILEEAKHRFIVLEGVRGETVIVAFGAPAVDFEEFLPEAQKMLKTVDWKGS